MDKDNHSKLNKTDINIISDANSFYQLVNSSNEENNPTNSKFHKNDINSSLNYQK